MIHFRKDTGPVSETGGHSEEDTHRGACQQLRGGAKSLADPVNHFVTGQSRVLNSVYNSKD
jgi:hypothetical protein